MSPQSPWKLYIKRELNVQDNIDILNSQVTFRKLLIIYFTFGSRQLDV